MSSARSASATTSLPKPGALTPAGMGRSRPAIVASRSGCGLALSRCGFDTFGPAMSARRGRWRHPTGSRALTQPREHLQAGIAVGGLHADLLLEGENGLDGIAAGAAVDAVGLVTMRDKPALDFLDLIQSRRALAAGELLMEGRIAVNKVAEMEQRKRVAGRWIVGIDRAKVLTDQKRRTALDRLPEFHLIAGPRVGRAIGALHAQLLPFGIRVPSAVIGQTAAAVWQFHFAAPGLAAAVFSALDQIARGAGE